MPDTPTYEEIETVVHAFYQKVIENPELGHFFAHIQNFSAHEERIVGFWWVSMGGKLEQPIKVDMIGKHFPLGIKQPDLELWISLFVETLEEHLPEGKALYWMDKVMTIAARLKQIVIDHQPMGVQIKEP